MSTDLVIALLIGIAVAAGLGALVEWAAIRRERRDRDGGVP